MDDQELGFADLRELPDVWAERPDGVVLEGVVGSRAYGLAWEGSDTDRRGVFLAPSEEFFGLDDVRETADNPLGDEVLHELGRFVRQALKANPAMIDLLWLEEYEVCTEVGIGLIGLRQDLLSAPRVRGSYLHAAAELLKLVHRGGARTSKTARHMARLLVTGYGLWSTGHLRVRLTDPRWVWDFGERVADGDAQAAEHLVAEYEQRFADTPTVLPDTPDRGRVDAWLKETRRDALLAVKPN